MKYFLFCMVLTAPLEHLPAQTVRHLDNYTVTQIDNAVNAEATQSGLPGVNLAVIYNGRVAYTKAYGLASVGVNATTSTKYPIASVSKTITGMMAMRMVADGHLALDTPVSRYIGSYNGTGITIRHLLSHQSGIGHYDDCPGGYNGAFNAGLSQLVVAGCSRCMTPPGSGTLYSTFGSTLLGAIIDVVGRDKYNKGYVSLYNEWIRDAGGIPDLTAESGNNVAGIAQGYNSSGNPQFGNWNDIGWKLPAGGFVGTAHDLAGYGVGVINHTFLDSARSYNTMWRTQSVSGGATNHCSTGLRSAFGLAFFVSGSGTQLAISHDGENDHGFCSSLQLWPRQKAGIILLDNRENSNGALGNIAANIEAYVLCPQKRDFTSSINWGGSWVYEASQSITASGGITTTNSSFVFDAGTEVILKPGFEALNGSQFRAVIEGCGGNVKPYY